MDSLDLEIAITGHVAVWDPLARELEILLSDRITCLRGVAHTRTTVLSTEFERPLCSAGSHG